MGMLDGRVAIVTGGGRGVGAEIAKAMAAAGAKILVVDPGVGGGGEGGDTAPAQDIANQIKAAGGEAAANFGSVTNFGECLNMIEQARDELGGCHIVCNPAGILRDRMFHKMDPQDWQDVIDVHLTGHYNINRAAINLFREQEYGRMIMVSSTSGVLGNVGQANYGAAKMGIVALCKIVAMENASKGITANALLPSADTRMTRSVPTPKDPTAAAVRDERLNRSRADAIAPLAVFLASEGASYVPPARGGADAVWLDDAGAHGAQRRRLDAGGDCRGRHAEPLQRLLQAGRQPQHARGHADDLMAWWEQVYAPTMTFTSSAPQACIERRSPTPLDTPASPALAMKV
jgi:NAD(P)-dependent dehydrogenase (short-subunit alcohol dehydrogenase family)